MKKTPLNQQNFKQRNSKIRLLPTLTSLFAFLILGLLTSCSTETTTAEVETSTGNVDNEVHVAFAGGGWRAHTGHAAWVMSLLHSNNNPTGCVLSQNSDNSECLKQAFANVKTISGNSGGSWFSSMLMYDSDIVKAITSQNAFNDWGSTDGSNPNQGWLGKQETYFNAFNSTCGSKKGSGYLECILEKISLSEDNPNWAELVENLVYKGYDWQAYGNLNSNTHLPWAKDKTLLMAGTVLNNSVLLNDQDDEIYYQVCQEPNKVVAYGDDGAYCEDVNGYRLITPDVWPVTFTSLGESTTPLIAPFFFGTARNTYHLGYSGAYATTSTPVKRNTITSGQNNTGNVPVMRAAAASSAAAGFAASYNIYDKHLPTKCDPIQWDCMFHFRNLALGFSIPTGTQNVEYVSDKVIDGKSLSELNTDRVLRIADGGAIDNSAVAQLVTYLQTNSKSDGFNIVAFDDVQSNDIKTTDKDKYPSTDISYMFDGAPSTGLCVEEICLTPPPLKIFKPASGNPDPYKKYTWTIKDSNGQATTDYLHYYIYEVETTSNPSFNIDGDHRGTLHVFASEFGCANTAPINEGDDFPCYNEMISKMKNTLRSLPDGKTSTKNGSTLLSEAFNL